jgi:hypothetical protein
MRLGSRQVPASARASNFHEALRTAADGANLLPERRALPSGFAAVTDCTEHGTASHGDALAINAWASDRHIARVILPVLYLQYLV